MIAALLLAVALGAPANETARNGCARWDSATVPPPTIRVLIGRHVQRVPFALYVARVVSSEWNTVPVQLRMAGAVAVKQYGWWKTLHPRRSRYGCFDLHDSTADQIYRHHKSPPDYVWQAVQQTWNWRVLRDGRLAHTGYRTGRKGRCAGDVSGYHLFARSAIRCANAGWSARRILATYYEARVV